MIPGYSHLLLPYQKKAVAHILRQPYAGIFALPGSGKTLITLAAIFDLINRDKVSRVLIVSTKRIIYHVWPEEIAKFKFPFSYGYLHLSKHPDPTDQIVFTTCDSLHKVVKQKLDYDMLVVDESSKFKANRPARSVRHKNIKLLLDKAKRRVILTGSPIANHLHDIWGQAYILDKGEALGKKVTYFRQDYFLEKVSPFGYFTEYIQKPDSQDRVAKKISDLIYIVDEKSITGIPERKTNDICVHLPKHSRGLYSQMLRQLCYKVDKQKIVASNSAVKVMRLKQIANGFTYDEHKQAVHIHDEKIEALLELVDELQGESLLVVYETICEGDVIQTRLKGRAFARISGASSMKDVTVAFDRWNSGELDVLLVQAQTISHGVNLQAGGHCICFFSIPWSFDTYDQLIRRLQRKGGQNVTVYRLLAAKSVDSVICAVLRQKLSDQAALLQIMATLANNLLPD